MYDTTRPVVSVAHSSSTNSARNPFKTNTNPVPIAITFDSLIAEGKLVDSELSISGAAPSGFAGSYSQGQYGYNMATVFNLGLVPDATETLLHLSVPDSVVTDAAGNFNFGSESLSFIYDNTKPTVTITHGIATTGEGSSPVVTDVRNQEFSGRV